ncbi:RNA-dependent RNA polymerase 6 [Sesamum angolense]|uniref:RNA-dependent RNA polymerase 6 n=1 Tax=Sesamum angolense TaxID=2727404 RepID=A0AAE1WAB1_9LAMI|nr:RNA-dependent RNA polymerase 6 [Sesamum angolense]
MVNESLGTICNAHVVHADLSEYGALDEKCIKLAELAATAVDFPKTGKIVHMPAELKPKMYPDFMGKEEFQSYNSNKILGSTSFIADAWNCKCSYDGQLIGLLGQYKVNREEEVVTGHIWSMPKYSSKKQGEVKERLKHAYSTLRKEFRKVFECMGPEFDQFSDDEKNIMYERKASAWYQVTYQESWVKKSKELHAVDDAGKSVMLSFAWIAADYLARIKIKRRMMENSISTKPIDSLGSFLLFGYKATLPWKLNSWSSPNSHDMGIATLTLPTSLPSCFFVLEVLLNDGRPKEENVMGPDGAPVQGSAHRRSSNGGRVQHEKKKPADYAGKSCFDGGKNHNLQHFCIINCYQNGGVIFARLWFIMITDMVSLHFLYSKSFSLIKIFFSLVSFSWCSFSSSLFDFSHCCAVRPFCCRLKIVSPASLAILRLGKQDEKETKRVQESLQSLEFRLAVREHICKNLQEKVRDLGNQLAEERKARLK